MVDAVLYLGGEMDSVRVTNGSPVEVTTAAYFDSTYARCAIQVPNSNSSFRNYLIEPSTQALATIAMGETFWYHWELVTGGTSGLTMPFGALLDSNGYPWFNVQGGGSGGTIRPAYNSGTGPSPTWTTIGSAFSMGSDVRVAVDIKLTLGTPHTYEVYIANALQFNGTFTQASFLNITGVQHSAAASNMYSAHSQMMATRGIPTVGAKVDSFEATGTGNSNAWTGAYTDINEIVFNDATGLQSTVVGDKYTFTMANIASLPAGYNIASVFTWTRAKISGAAPANLKHVLRIGSTDYDSSANVAGINFGYGPVGINWGPNDPTAAAWTKTTIDGMEVGAKSAT